MGGNGSAGYAADGSPALSSPIDFPESLIILPSGEPAYYEDSNRVLRKIDLSGNLQTLAGIPHNGGDTGDGGPATLAKVGDLEAMTFACGQLIFAGIGDTIRTIDSAGTITRVAGTSAFGFNGDGLAAGITNMSPSIGCITADAFGNLYVSDSSDYRIRKISSGCTPTPTPSVTPTPIVSLTHTPTPSFSATATISPSATLTATFSVTPTPTRHA